MFVSRDARLRAKGFTLIELVVVIIILGILAVVAAPKFINMQDEAEEAAILTQFAAFESAVKLYHSGWLASGHTEAVNNLESFGDGSVDSTDNGWPYATSGVNAEVYDACDELWHGLTDTDLTCAAVPDTQLATTPIDIAYTYSKPTDDNPSAERMCIYRMVHHIQQENTTKVMNYYPDTGKVEVIDAFYNKDGTPGTPAH
ncbi:type II secretion system protein [Shewanella submarina]|uniref:Type II secretion system protein n=1 Tax=Shewanella submarina TaxID=2016376 RepID=A0ABV7GHL4_9GAMM|nr:prepilin-type N-terminal cleavage/methylation domain-containing protein [Shewanella submarina]